MCSLNTFTMNRIIGNLLILMIVTLSLHAFPQAASVKSEAGFSEEELANFHKQATQLVGFMEYAFNTLGSSKSEYKEKDIIINQSFLKFFKDARVQIEDDLVEKRDVVTNKDVQAYLKDIDFFFRDVAFKFTVEEITRETNEKGNLYFKVRTSRNLNGTTIDGKKINDNKPRFIEINLDDASRDLKIVSIYTTRTSEEKELMSWWNSLDKDWRTFFSGNTVLNEEIPMSRIIAAGSAFLVVSTSPEDSGDTIVAADTLSVSSSSLLAEIRKIWRTEQLDLSGISGLKTLEPLSPFSALRYLNISGLTVSSLDPVRNLSKLESISAAGALIESLAPLQYTAGLRYLDISETFVKDISAVANFPGLEYLNLSGLDISDITPLQNLVNLRELKLSRLPLKDLNALSGLSQLETLDLSGTPLTSAGNLETLVKLRRISLERTYISDLSPLASLSSLEYVFLDNSPVSAIAPLAQLPDLKVIYCDKTMVTKAVAQSFMQLRPGVKVIFESEELSAWWGSLPEVWKDVFSQLVTLDNPPVREQLHEVSYLRKLDLSGITAVSSLDPLRKLSSLTWLDASGTGITEIMPLKGLFDLQYLNISGTAVIDLAPLSQTSSMQELHLSDSKVAALQPLAGMPNLRTLGMDKVNAAGLDVLTSLRRLQLLYADGVTGMEALSDKLPDSIPGLLLVYKTGELVQWWESLDPAWKQAFSNAEPVGVSPTREQLHRITQLTVLDLNGSKDLHSLQPLRMLRRLESLTMSGLPVSDILPLGLITRLRFLDCSGTPVSDLSALTTHRFLKTLNCSNTPIGSIEPLKFLPVLEDLDISGTQVSRLNPLSESFKLQHLNCSNTRVSSLKPIEGLDNLKTLKIYNTRISARNAERFRSSKPGVEITYY